MGATPDVLHVKPPIRVENTIVMLDEDEAGQIGRDDIAVRLSKFTFVRIHQFENPGTQPDQLSAEEVGHVLG